MRVEIPIPSLPRNPRHKEYFECRHDWLFSGSLSLYAGIKGSPTGASPVFLPPFHRPCPVSSVTFCTASTPKIPFS